MRCGAEQYDCDLRDVNQPINGKKPSHSLPPAFSLHSVLSPSVLKPPSEERIWTVSPILFCPQKIFLLPIFQNFVDYCAAGTKMEILIMSFILVCCKGTPCLLPPPQILLKRAREGLGKNIRDVLIWINPLLSTITASH